MASWTDGAAYAPIERPDGFATPEVDPLEAAVPQAARTPGPMPTPSAFAPSGPTVPLDRLRTAPAAHRNPAEPFSVSGGLMTTASSAGTDGARDPHAPFAAYGDAPGAPGVDTLPPPTGAPLAAPPGAPSGARGMSPQQQSTQRTLVFLAVASCVIGLTIPAVGPWMLFVAGLLSVRTTALTGRTGNFALGTALALLVLGGLLPPAGAAALSRLAAVVFGAVFAGMAVRRSRPRH